MIDRRKDLFATVPAERFSAFILFGLILFGGSTLANRVTTLGADKWGLNMGRYGHEEEYGEGGGLTAIGLTVVLIPQSRRSRTFVD